MKVAEIGYAALEALTDEYSFSVAPAFMVNGTSIF